MSPLISAPDASSVRARGAMLALMLALVFGSATAPALAGESTPYPGTLTLHSQYSFDTLLNRLRQAIAENRMGLVAQASASAGAAARGVKIPGNAVIMVFRNDFAVRMLEASVPAGIEAPLRLYLTENPDHTASLTYRLPSAVFAPYGNPKLDEMATELDTIFDRIVRNALSQ